jgi:hypothetical protein
MPQLTYDEKTNQIKVHMYACMMPTTAIQSYLYIYGCTYMHVLSNEHMGFRACWFSINKIETTRAALPRVHLCWAIVQWV